MKKRKGSALLLISALASLLILIAITTNVNAISDINVTNEEKIRTQLEFACESGLNRARSKIEQAFNNGELSNLEPEVTFQGTSTDDTGFSPEEKAFTDEAFVGGTTDYYEFTIQSNGSSPDITVRYAIVNGREDDEDGWKRSQGFTTNKMTVEAVAYAPGLGWLGLSEDVWARRTSLFMYQIFFEDELEIAPGPTFSLTGLIHTNKDLFLNSNSTMSIHTDSLTSAGDIYRGRLDSNSIGGAVKISENNKDGNLVTMSSGDDSENEDWKNLAADNWGGTVKDSSLGAPDRKHLT